MAFPMGAGCEMVKFRPRDKIADFLIHNHEDIMTKAKWYTKQRDELFKYNNKEWREKIQSQYIHYVMYDIAEMITFEHGIDTETIIEFFESFDFEQYIGGVPCEDCI